MGYGYARDVVYMLIADNDGLTREQLLELNRERTHAVGKWVNKVLDEIVEGYRGFFVVENGVFKLKEGVDTVDIQETCKLGARIALGFYNYKPNFWQGEIDAIHKP